MHHPPPYENLSPVLVHLAQPRQLYYYPLIATIFINASIFLCFERIQKHAPRPTIDRHNIAQCCVRFPVEKVTLVFSQVTCAFCRSRTAQTCPPLHNKHFFSLNFQFRRAPARRLFTAIGSQLCPFKWFFSRPSTWKKVDTMPPRGL